MIDPAATDPALLDAFDAWIVKPEQGRTPAYWALLAFAAGWAAHAAHATESAKPANTLA